MRLLHVVAVVIHFDVQLGVNRATVLSRLPPESNFPESPRPPRRQRPAYLPAGVQLSP